MLAACRQWREGGEYRLYFVTLKVEVALSTDEQLAIRSRFLDWRKKNRLPFEIQMVAEIDRKDWIHSHGIIIAPKAAGITADCIRSGWKVACGDLPTDVQIEVVKSVPAAIRYSCGDCLKKAKDTLLFVRSNENPSHKRFSLTWGTRTFYRNGKGKTDDAVTKANWLKLALAGGIDTTWAEITAALNEIAV